MRKISERLKNLTGTKHFVEIHTNKNLNTPALKWYIACFNTYLYKILQNMIVCTHLMNKGWIKTKLDVNDTGENLYYILLDLTMFFSLNANVWQNIIISTKWMCGFWPNLHGYICMVTSRKKWLAFDGLTLFSRSLEDHKCQMLTKKV